LFLSISVGIYNLFIRLYELGIYLLATQNDKASRWYLGRKNIYKQIEQAIASGEIKAERIWMHCASLGEFEQGRPLIEALRKERPNALIILTFFSPSGYDVRKNYPNADHVFYLPSDTRNNAKRFLYLVRPTLVIFVKYEFWYHYFNETRKLKIPFVLISAIFRKNQLFFKWYGLLYRKMLHCLTHIFVQDNYSVELLTKAGFANVTRTNDTRIDRVAHVVENARSLPTLQMFLDGSKALVGGSVYETENDMLYQACNEKLITGKIIIVPHNVDHPHIVKLQEKWGESAILYSSFDEKEAKDKTVLIVDTIGLLSNIYKYADMAVIGGGFGKSIHNTLEPAAFGIPVLFGPKYHKFQEAKDFIEIGAGFCFSNYEDLKQILLKLKDKPQRDYAGQKAGTYIKEHTGGTETVLAHISSKLSSP
jgi:3-deoxy-D-manno-octulosonic-acid transferase